jgi:hypothetical protein
VVTTGTEGVIRNRSIAISAGTARASVVAAGATLAGTESTNVFALLDQAKGVIEKINATLIAAYKNNPLNSYRQWGN